MAPTPIKESPIYGDFSSIASRTNSKATANPTLELVEAVEMSMDDFAERNSSGSLAVKDLLISFFSDQKVINWTYKSRFLRIQNEFQSYLVSTVGIFQKWLEETLLDLSLSRIYWSASFPTKNEFQSHLLSPVGILEKMLEEILLNLSLSRIYWLASFPTKM